MEGIEIFDMPTAATEDTVHSIVANSVPGKLPVEFTVDGEKVISINTLKEEFKMLKFEPILVASGLTREEFDEMKDSLKDSYRGLIIEQCDDKFYIVDFPSMGHECYCGNLTQYWPSSFASEFLDASWIFLWPHAPTVQGIEPDWSGWVRPQYCISEIDGLRPFIVLEVAWSQSSLSLADKLQKWLDLGVTWVIGIDRSFTRSQTRIFARQIGRQELILDLTFSAGQRAEFDVVLPKSLLFASFDIKGFDLHPERENLVLPVRIVMD